TPARVSKRGELDGQTVPSQTFRLPPLPFGYHTLELELRNRLHRSLIISAPRDAFSPGCPPSKGAAKAQGPRPPNTLPQWGVFLPLYAAHSQQSWGAGNLGDWQKLGAWLASSGGRVLAT